MTTLESMAIEMPPVSAHPNRLPFRGVLTVLDAPSDRPPAGARGHRVVLTRAAAEAALPSLIGMAVDFTAGFDGHDARRKVGIISSADIRSNKIEVAGYIFARDFPEVVRELQTARDLGMSYEVADAAVEDIRAPVWKLTAVTFTGAAILRRKKAAYEQTSISLAATTFIQNSTLKNSKFRGPHERRTYQAIPGEQRTPGCRLRSIGTDHRASRRAAHRP